MNYQIKFRNVAKNLGEKYLEVRAYVDIKDKQFAIIYRYPVVMENYSAQIYDCDEKEPILDIFSSNSAKVGKLVHEFSIDPRSYYGVKLNIQPFCKVLPKIFTEMQNELAKNIGI